MRTEVSLAATDHTLHRLHYCIRFVHCVRSLLAELIAAAVLTALELAGLVWLIGKLWGR